MSRLSALGDLLGALFERGGWPIGSLRLAMPEGALETLAAELISSKGEASGVALATRLLAGYRGLDADGKRAFFRHLAEAWEPDRERALAAAEAFRDDPGPATQEALAAVLEPRRQELFRRLNMAPGGTGALVRMRADLLAELREAPELAPIDRDFRHLLASWFNRGFLVLRPIDWQTPAAVLDKIIAYEAVHQIDSWEELRRRVDPPDRRCFAFFHPSMPDEPLIFVEVALTREIPGSIQALLAPERRKVAPEEATVAVFYSISNCQPGLAGVSFGAFLIKQVAEDLTRELPGLTTFVTLSPVPGLVRWLGQTAAGEPEGDAAEVLAMLERPGWGEDWAEHWNDDAVAAARPLVLGLAARYLLDAKRADGQPADPVARFHLGNGAELAAMHWPADISANGLKNGAGVMVNYRYRLDRIEANHEAYAAEGKIAASRAVRGLRAA
jgi:malonyl-CoA decarboxylase